MQCGDGKRGGTERGVEIELPGSGLGTGGERGVEARVEQIQRGVVNGDGGHTARIADVQGRQVEVHGESIADLQVTKL